MSYFPWVVNQLNPPVLLDTAKPHVEFTRHITMLPETLIFDSPPTTQPALSP